MVDEIIKTALLGTDRYVPQTGLGFTDVMEKIAGKHPDKEARFLTQAAVYFMLQSASYPLTELPQPQPLAIAENENYIAENAQAVLQYALTENNELLLEYCFALFEQQHKIITPFLVPDVLEKYASGGGRKQALALCGQTGREMIQLQRPHETTTAQEQEDVVLASPAQIKKWITDIRAKEPQKIWEIESGNKLSAFEEMLNREKPEKRSELLELLQTGLSAQDEPELLKLMKTKSKNVKLTLTRLLIMISGSAVQKDFSGLLRELLTYETQKQFFGLKKSKVFTLNENHQLSPAQKAYGLEDISSEKGVSDGMYHLYQCITMVPLQVIAKAFEVSEQEVIDQLYTNWKNAYLQRAFAENVEAFKNKLLLNTLLKTGQHIALATYLPFNEALAFFKPILKHGAITSASRYNAMVVYNWLFSQPYRNVDAGFGTDLLNYLKAGQFHIQGKEYYQLGLYLPPECGAWLQKEINRVPAENEDNYFQKHFQQNIQQTLKAIEDKNLLNQQ
jgi:Family of unknown function (DUF5691)